MYKFTTLEPVTLYASAASTTAALRHGASALLPRSSHPHANANANTTRKAVERLRGRGCQCESQCQLEFCWLW